MKIKRRYEHLPPIDRKALTERIALYQRLHARNAGIHGRWSPQALHAARILGMFQDLERSLTQVTCS